MMLIPRDTTAVSPYLNIRDLFLTVLSKFKESAQVVVFVYEKVLHC